MASDGQVPRSDSSRCAFCRRTFVKAARASCSSHQRALRLVVWRRYARDVDPSTRAQTLLEAAVGLGASFRDEQLDAILALAVDRRRLLVVERTGWGKSLVYFIATRLLR